MQLLSRGPSLPVREARQSGLEVTWDGRQAAENRLVNGPFMKGNR